MTDWPILTVVTFLPLVGVLLLLLTRDDSPSGRRNVLTISLLTTLVTFVVSLFIWIGFDNANPGFQMVEKHAWLNTGISYAVGVDGISMLFVILTTFLMPFCVLASWFAVEKRIKEYMIAFLILEVLMLGVFVSLDIVLFYVFFEAGLIPMFIIIGVWGGKDRVYASYKFFLYTLLGSVLMLLAIMAMYWNAGTTSIPELLSHKFPAGMQTWLWLAFFASFAVKMPMWPVHTWLPDAHVQAPTAGSVILAGILLKLGGYGFIRFSLAMFPVASEHFAPFVFALSVLAIIYTSLVALMQTDIKKLIAYSRSRTWAMSPWAFSRPTFRACRAPSTRCSRTVSSPARSSSASALSTTACIPAKSRPMAVWSTTCRNMRLPSWSLPWRMLVFRERRASLANS